MEIQWWLHARQRVLERGISESLVRKILHEPEQVIGHGTHKIFQGRVTDQARHKEYLVRVFTEVHRDVIVIRSVYRTSKIHKYWRAE